MCFFKMIIRAHSDYRIHFSILKKWDDPSVSIIAFYLFIGLSTYEIFIPNHYKKCLPLQSSCEDKIK